MREDWISDKLSNCIKLKSGDGLTAKDMTLGDYPVFGGNRIAGYHNEFNQTGEHVIIGRVGALCGNVRYINENIWLTDNAFRISEFKYDFDLKFLYYFLNHVNLRSYARQTAQPVISNSSLKNVNLTFPKSLQEQQQIVTILDQAFEAIDQAKVNIEKNIKNAKELFQSKLNDIFSQKGEGWEEKSLGDVCYVLNGYAFKSKEAIEESNTQLLRMGNLYKNMLDLNRRSVFYPDSYREDYKDFLLKEGDLIMSLTGTVDKTDYGYTVKIPKINVDLLLNQRIMKIEVHDTKILNKDYLKNYLLSPDFLSRLYDTASGTRQANLSSRKILSLKINFPIDIERQLEIVRQLKQMRDYSNKIEAKYVTKLRSLDELKKSILQMAFSGELTNKKLITI
jgi:type I restriction enzyme S subunit